MTVKPHLQDHPVFAMKLPESRLGLWDAVKQLVIANKFSTTKLIYSPLERGNPVRGGVC